MSFIFYLLLRFTLSQDYADLNGSIFELISQRPVRRSSQIIGDNIQTPRIQQSDVQGAYSNNQTPLEFNENLTQPNGAIPASDTLQNQVDRVILANSQITQTNQSYQEQGDELIEELINTIQRLENARIDQLMDEQQYSYQIANLQAQSTQLYQQYDSMNDDSNNGKNEDYKLDVTDAMIYIIAVGFLYLILQSFRVIMGWLVEDFLQPALHNLFSDVSILTFLICFTNILDYSQAFDEDRIDFDYILLGMCVFTGIWLLLGLMLIIAAQSFSRTWAKLETKTFDLANLSNQYDQAYIEYTRNQSNLAQYRQLRGEMQYSVMKQLFISPVFIPSPTECLLRSDFDFGEYLSRSMADVISTVFQLTWLGYFIIVLGIFIWRWFLFQSDVMEIILIWVMPLVILIISLLLVKHLYDTYYKLVPYVYDPAQFNLPENNQDRDLEVNLFATPIPPYLLGSLPGKDEQNQFLQCLCCTVHPLKLTCAFIFSSRFPSRHELLFWFDSFGPRFMIGLLQFVCVSLTLWISAIIMYFDDQAWDLMSWSSIVLIILAFLLWSFLSLFIVPEVTRYITLTTKIEQMKDRGIVQQVIVNQKHKKALRTFRLYRQLKMIYREVENQPEQVNLPLKINQLTEEAFNLLAEHSNRGSYVHISKLDQLTQLFGIKLDMDELRLFAKECEPDQDNQIQLEGFKKAVQALYNSSGLKSQQTALQVIQYYLREFKNKRAGEPITLEDVQDLLNEFGWHFNQEDIDEFVWEVRYLMDSSGDLDAEVLADMMKNDIEIYPS